MLIRSDSITERSFYEFSAADCGTATQNLICLYHAKTGKVEGRKGWLTVKVVLKGAAHFYFEGQEVRIQEGYFLLLHPGTSYCVAIDSVYPAHIIEIFFTQRMQQRLMAMQECNEAWNWGGRDHLLEQGVYRMNTALQALLETFPIIAAESKAYEMYEEHFLQQMIHQLGEYYPAYEKELHALPVQKLSTKKELYHRLQIARNFILTGYESGITLKDIGRASSLAPSHLLKHFPILFNATPHQMIIHLRINLAKELLLFTELPITEVIQKTGFKNDSSFIRLFKTLEGCTPLSYRLKHAVLPQSITA